MIFQGGPILRTHTYTRTVIARFPDRDALDDGYHSDAYQALVQHRFRAATGNFIVVDGIDF